MLIVSFKSLGSRTYQDNQEGFPRSHRKIVSILLLYELVGGRGILEVARKDCCGDFGRIQDEMLTVYFSYPRLTLDFHTNKRIIDEVVCDSGCSLLGLSS